MIKTCKTWLQHKQAFVMVKISEVSGSSPREIGATLAVSTHEIVGTIGGGRLEWDAIIQAKAMLASRQTSMVVTIALGPEIGQCCGGRVTLSFDWGNEELITKLAIVDAADMAARPLVHIYGAGHVGRALAHALSPLPLRVRLIDSRMDELEKCQAHHIEKHMIDAPVSFAENSPAHAAHVIMTHSHTLDSLIAGAILDRGEFLYLGIIGSKTKRASFRKAFQAMGISKQMIERVVCPIGGNRVADKRPEVIAALTTAEIVQAVLN